MKLLRKADVNTDLNRRALEILSQWDRTLYIDLTEPLRRGIGQTFYAEKDGVLVNVKGVWMVGAMTAEAAEQMVQIIRREGSGDDEVCAHGKACRRMLDNTGLFFWYDHPCYVCAYYAGAQFDLPQDLEIRMLDAKYAELLSRTYTMIRDSENALELARSMIDNGVFGGFLKDECVGYIGLHGEGSMGMLEVFEQYRNRGFGTALEMFLINRLVSRGMVPFGHVLDNNEVSLKMQKMLGFRIADDMVFWGKLLTDQCRVADNR